MKLDRERTRSWRARVALAVFAVLATVAGGAIAPASASAAAYSVEYNWSASAGYSEFGLGNFSVTNKAGNFVFQSDGNLVLYNNGAVRWEARSYGQGATKISFQRDGNIVIYRSNNTAVWAANVSTTCGASNWKLAVYGGNAFSPPTANSFCGSSGRSYFNAP